MLVKQAQSILVKLQQRTTAIYEHLKINPKLRRPGIKIIISPPATAAEASSLISRGGIYAEHHYDEVKMVLKGERERVSQKARTLSIQPGSAVEAALCHELMHDIFYAIFGSSERNQFYAVVRASLETHYVEMTTKEFWASLQTMEPEKEFLTGFFHVEALNCNPLSIGPLERHASAAELFAYLGMEFLGYPGCAITGGSWLIGHIPPQLIEYFRNLNLSNLSDSHWQIAVSLRVGLRNARDQIETQQLEDDLTAFYSRPALAAV